MTTNQRVLGEVQRRVKKATLDNVQGTPIASISGTPTGVEETVRIHFVVAADARITATARGTETGNTVAAEVLESGTNTTLVPGVTLTFGATIADDDRANVTISETFVGHQAGGYTSASAYSFSHTSAGGDTLNYGAQGGGDVEGDSNGDAFHAYETKIHVKGGGSGTIQILDDDGNLDETFTADHEDTYVFHCAINKIVLAWVSGTWAGEVIAEGWPD